eukprot:m.268169 g.268169  ORF g.268169 m.268169 type:complete len:268 (-) comp15652_c0_seq9:2101-2904(-)
MAEGTPIPVEVVPIPLFSDNYAYLVYDAESKQGAVVDPAEPSKVVDVVQRLGVNVTAILTTHSHWDHADGNEVFKKMVPGCVCYGGAGDGAQAVDTEVNHGDTITVGSMSVSVIGTPCHTPGHVCYYIKTPTDGVVFTGDTLFIAGCGNFNSGTPQQMYTALCERLGSLDDATKVYVGHEYTVKNLQFAALVEPQNEALAAKLAWAKAQREEGRATVPSTIGDEKQTNPFMRCGEKDVLAFSGTTDAVESIAFVRRAKTKWGRTGSL